MKFCHYKIALLGVAAALGCATPGFAAPVDPDKAAAQAADAALTAANKIM